MTAAEKAGQVILARYPGENALSEAQKYHLGGYVMFGVDFRGSTPEEITAEIAEIQSASKLRMLFAADEEGGTVVRISKYPQYRAEPFPAQAEVLSQGLDAVSSEAQEISGLMSSLGLNMNLAPVCDLAALRDGFHLRPRFQHRSTADLPGGGRGCGKLRAERADMRTEALPGLRQQPGHSHGDFNRRAPAFRDHGA